MAEENVFKSQNDAIEFMIGLDKSLPIGTTIKAYLESRMMTTWKDRVVQGEQEAKQFALERNLLDLIEKRYVLDAREVIKKPKVEKVKTPVFNPVEYADRIMQETPMFYDKNENLWRYNNEEGIWSKDATLYIKSKLRKEIFRDEEQRKHYAEEIIDYIKGISWKENKVIELPKNLIPFQNCLYNLDTDIMEEFHAKYFITSKIPIIIDSKHDDYSMIDFFLEEIVGKEKKQIIYELLAYCMYRSYPYQKFFIFYGDGNNGKSAILKLFSKFLGFDNVTSVKPQDLTNNRFAAAGLFDKLANISPDIPYTSIDDTSIIRELTGEDQLTCERKYEEAFKFYNFAKIIFSANELPQVKDRTYAFNRRLYIILFDKKIIKPDAEIIDKIASPSQLSALAWRLIQELKNLRARGFVFSNNPIVEEQSRLYDELSNNLLRFINEACIVSKGTKLADWELKERFEVWCLKKGMRVWKVGEINDFMRNRYQETRMNQEFYEQDVGKFVSKSIKSWEGLAWKPENTQKA